MALVALMLLGGALWWVGQSQAAFNAPCDIESDYYCIRVEPTPLTGGRPGAVMIIDHLGHGLNDQHAAQLLHAPYLHFIDEMTKARLGIAPLDTFMIGGGAYSLPRAWQADYGASGRRIIAEVDPEVTRAAVEQMWFTPAAGTEIIHADARVALQAYPPRPLFDVILGDAFHDISIPAHLVTREFHQEVASRLKPAGFYAVNVVESRQNPGFLLALVKTLKQDFAHVEVWLDEAEMTDRRVTFMVLAAPRKTPGNVLAAVRGIERRWKLLPPSDYGATPEQLASYPILTDNFAPVDRLMSHVLLSPELSEGD